jgi:hypothetical protein
MALGSAFASGAAAAGPGDHIRVGNTVVTPSVSASLFWRSNPYLSDGSDGEEVRSGAGLTLRPALDLKSKNSNYDFSLGSSYTGKKYITDGMDNLNRWSDFEIRAALRALPEAKEWPLIQDPVYQDVAASDPDRAFIEGLTAWGAFQPAGKHFTPDGKATRAALAAWMKSLGLPVSNTLANNGTRALTRSEAAQHVWRALRLQGEWFPPRGRWLQPEGDDDGDGIKDYEDPLPFDRDNNNIPDRFQPPPATPDAQPR